MVECEAKQVIVVRHDLHMRMGKVAAQAAHASIAFLTNKFRDRIEDYFDPMNDPLFYVVPRFRVSPAERAWIEGRFTKICVRVDSEEELLRIYEEAEAAGLTAYLITDAGLTEFKGIPTNTCVAIGPNFSDEIDPITGHLKLL